MAVNMKVSDPVSEATKSALPSAATARAEAAKGFRTQVETLLENAIRAGQTDLELNITAVSPSFVSSLEDELKAQGYLVIRNTHVRGAEGFKILKISF